MRASHQCHPLLPTVSVFATMSWTPSGISTTRSALNTYEAAIQASADAGYSIQWYEERGVAWVIRRLEIRYYLQVRYGDELGEDLDIRVRTDPPASVNTTSRVSSDGARVARGRALWVYIDSKSGRPIRLPEEIKIAPCPRVAKKTSEFAATSHARWRMATGIVTGARCKATARSPRPGAPRSFSTGSSRLTTTRYAWPAIRSISCAPETGWFSGGHEIEYFSPARDNDEIEIVMVCEVGKVRGAWIHEIYEVKSKTLLARDYSLGIFVNANGKPTADAAIFAGRCFARPAERWIKIALEFKIQSLS